jgi:cytochrome c oxidase subunit IV
MSSQHIVSIKLYAVIFVALIVLTLTTTGVAFIDLGGNLNAAIALAIAAAKALLVILFFMHVRYSHPLTWIFAGVGFLWLLILLTLMMSDVLTRLPSV